MHIKGNLTRGRSEKIDVHLDEDKITHDGLFGGMKTQFFPKPCYRCKGTNFAICRHYDDWVAFCLTEACLKQDSDNSKAIARDELNKKNERERGNSN